MKKIVVLLTIAVLVMSIGFPGIFANRRGAESSIVNEVDTVDSVGEQHRVRSDPDTPPNTKDVAMGRVKIFRGAESSIAPGVITGCGAATGCKINGIGQGRIAIGVGSGKINSDPDGPPDKIQRIGDTDENRVRIRPTDRMDRGDCMSASCGKPTDVAMGRIRSIGDEDVGIAPSSEGTRIAPEGDSTNSIGEDTINRASGAASFIVRGGSESRIRIRPTGTMNRILRFFGGFSGVIAPETCDINSGGGGGDKITNQGGGCEVIAPGVIDSVIAPGAGSEG